MLACVLTFSSILLFIQSRIDPFTFKEVGGTFAHEVLLAELIEIGLAMSTLS